MTAILTRRLACGYYGTRLGRHHSWEPLGAGVERCADCGVERITRMDREATRALGMPWNKRGTTIYRLGPRKPWTTARPRCGG